MRLWHNLPDIFFFLPTSIYYSLQWFQLLMICFVSISHVIKKQQLSTQKGSHRKSHKPLWFSYVWFLILDSPFWYLHTGFPRKSKPATAQIPSWSRISGPAFYPFTDNQGVICYFCQRMSCEAETGVQSCSLRVSLVRCAELQQVPSAAVIDLKNIIWFYDTTSATRKILYIEKST